MALQDYIPEGQYENIRHQYEEEFIENPYLHNEKRSYEQVNNRQKPNDLMNVRPEVKDQKRKYYRTLRILGVIIFVCVFVCLSVFFFLYDFDKDSSDDIVYVRNYNNTDVVADNTSIPDNKLEITSTPDNNNLTSIIDSNSNITPANDNNSVIPSVPENNTTPPVSNKNSNVNKENRSTNQQDYYYDNPYQYESTAKNDYYSRDYSDYQPSYENSNYYPSSGESQAYYPSYNDNQSYYPEYFNGQYENSSNLGVKSYPVVGERAYNDYLEKNLKKLPESAYEGNRGKIILLFKVNERGRPFDIAILRSVNQFVDSEVKQLLRDGPDWTPCDNDARLEITF